MDKIIIKGGKKLSGEVEISGSKNSSLPILFASLLTDEPCEIKNVPSLADVDTTINFLNFIGKKTIKTGNTVNTFVSKKYKHVAPYDLVRKMRASVLVMGTLLARLKRVDVSLPGGCSIGARPINIHLEAFRKMQVKISVDEGYVKLSADKRLKGANIKLHFASVGATENILLAAVLAEGKTVINNAACEPEIVDLSNFLNKMGAKISGSGSKRIVVIGVKKLSGTSHEVIPDRIEAATYIISAAITKGEIVLKNAAAVHIKTVIEKLKKSGLLIKEMKNSIYVKWVKNLKPQNIKTAVYPGFPTDVQAQWMALQCLLKGSAVIEENVFENRFMHVLELQRLGANLTIDGKKVYVKGVNKLSGAPVMVSDLRAGAALVLAGLAADEKTTISRIYHLDRGYDMLEKKLRKLGADIKRVHA
ncbi:MAG: UDP-N-acetylglucosamine 1-carboxyvinyltransferase [Elusimicrobiota bacterium]|jgi:UDP-N-acetylglucosamine 1-carboxyvinyltransferase|nr:UDP-N-acetylglucosamine 1-carboxyvinyltransferase [Elusimicrobiota bacterium]